MKRTERDWLTTGEAAKFLSCSLQTVIRLFDRGKIEGWKLPGRKFRRISKSYLEEFKKRYGVPANESLFLEQNYSLDKGVRILIINKQGEFILKIGESLKQYCQLEIFSEFCSAVFAALKSKHHLILIAFPAKNTDIFSEILSFSKAIHQTNGSEKTKIITVIDGSQPNNFLEAGFDSCVSISGDTVKDTVEIIMAIGVAAKGSFLIKKIADGAEK